MKKKIGLLLLVLLSAAFAGGAFCWHYYSQYVDINTIYPHIKIQGINVGGMTEDEARQRVDEYVEGVAEKTVTLSVEGKKKSFPLSRTGFAGTVDDAVNQAYQLGRQGNILKRLIEIKEISENQKDIKLSFTIDKNKTEKFIKRKGKSFETEKKDAQISREDGKFIIQKEVNGVSINFKENAEKLAELIENPQWEPGDVIFAMDYQTDPAEHTEKELSVIQDKLGTFTTSYAGSSDGRCENVENGAELINGTILYPGESVSVYEKTAPFNADNGYRLAGSYENGKTVQTYGGGICQVSTTLYNAVLRAELDITERQNHSMTVHYVKLSEDAAIAGTEKDLKFKNNLKHPIYIEGQTGGRTVTFTVYGKEYRDKERSIAFESQRTSTRPAGEKVIKDKSMEEGKKVVESPGTTGYTAKLWKVIYEDGKETDRILVNSSSYMSVKKIVRVGTKKKDTDKEKKKKKSDKNSKKKKTSDKKNKSDNKTKKTSKKK